MAPLATEPRQLLVVLNLARRKALYTLIVEITAFMRGQLEEPYKEDSQPHDPSSPSFPSSTTDAPLFARENSTSSSQHSPSPTAAPPRPPSPPSPELIRLRRAALANFDEWRRDALKLLKDAASANEDETINKAKQARSERLAREQADTPSAGESLIDFGGSSSTKETADAKEKEEDAIAELQRLYHPIPTRLTSIPLIDRREALSCVLLILLTTGKYAAHTRSLAMYLCSALGLPQRDLIHEEVEIAQTLVEGATSEAAQKQKEQMSADAEAEKRRQAGQTGRWMKVGLASVAGAAVIGITGGLAAPVVAGAIGGLMGSVGLGGVASFLGVFWMNGALVGTLFGAYGARMTGEVMNKYAREVSDFRFLPLLDEWGTDYRKPNPTPSSSPSPDKPSARRLHVTIGINGWLDNPQDVTRPWRALPPHSEVFALRFEMATLLELGESLSTLVSSYAWAVLKSEIIKRTVLAPVYAALWPASLLTGSVTSIDNPFQRARNRADKAGKVLADALIARVQGERPVTLVGFSLGGRVISSCLRELAERREFGLIDSVVLVGAPVPSGREYWASMRCVVAGKMFNVYSEHDCVLGYLYRASSAQLGVAGLQAIQGVEGVENLDLSEWVSGHLRYPDLMPKILARCGFLDVRGGEGPIEKEKEIEMTEEGSAEVGTLIDLGENEKAQIVAPNATTQAARGPARKTVVRSHSEQLMQELDPLGSLRIADIQPVSRPAALPTRPEMRTVGTGADASDQKPKPSEVEAVRAVPSKTTSAPAVPRIDDVDAKLAERGTIPLKKEDVSSLPTKTGTKAPVPALDSDDDDSEEDYGGIKMMDNDDMVGYDEPLVVDDSSK